MHLSSKSYALDGAVGDTYLQFTRSVRYPEKTTSCMLRLDIETRTQCGPYLSGERRERSITPRSAISLVHFLVADPEPSPVKRSSVTHTPDNTTRETELGQAEDALYAKCPPAECRYPGVQGKKFCSEKINCATISDHFISHGIENKSRKRVIHCEWNGCGKRVTRCAFVRHIREAHFAHKRGTRFHRLKKSPRRQPNTPVSWVWVCLFVADYTSNLPLT